MLGGWRAGYAICGGARTCDCHQPTTTNATHTDTTHQPQDRTAASSRTKPPATSSVVRMMSFKAGAYRGQEARCSAPPVRLSLGMCRLCCCRAVGGTPPGSIGACVCRRHAPTAPTDPRPCRRGCAAFGQRAASDVRRAYASTYAWIVGQRVKCRDRVVTVHGPRTPSPGPGASH
jgi:hypothetical protein